MNNDELQKIFVWQNYVVVQVGWAGKKGYRPSYLLTHRNVGYKMFYTILGQRASGNVDYIVSKMAIDSKRKSEALLIQIQFCKIGRFHRFWNFFCALARLWFGKLFYRNQKTIIHYCAYGSYRFIYE